MKMTEQIAARARKPTIGSFLEDKHVSTVLDIQGPRMLANRPSGVNFYITVQDSRSQVPGLEILRIIL